MPRQGHLETALHIIGFLKLRHNSRLAFDPSYCDIDHSIFWDCDWTDFYEAAVEAIPPNAQPQIGKEVDLSMFVDSNHAGNKRTRRSKTEWMVFMNMSLINWYFGTEFVAMKVRIKAIPAIQYKLRMMGISMSGASYIYGDSMLVIHNTSKPESTMKKKRNAIAYYAVHESMAMGETLTGHIKQEDNPAELLTKIITGNKHTHLVSLILYDKGRVCVFPY